MSKEKAIEMFVGGLVLDPNTQAPIVILKDESGDLCLPIWIGVAEATAIATVIKNLNLARPMTHDLLFRILSEAGLGIQRIVITDLKDSTYFAELVVSQGDKIFIFDSRPSDAIAIALRASAPIFVVEHVVHEAKISLQGQTSPSSEPPVESESGNVKPHDTTKSGSGEDFKHIDKDKWSEILAELDPEDFKYKM
ncbi:MAG: bifunctional nuclease family protein [Bdellovibrionales bacterium]|nr:bifunctional nuclease family protein [Bdellovibrionales bacterium]